MKNRRIRGRSPAKYRYQAIDEHPGRNLWQKLTRFLIGSFCLFLVGIGLYNVIPELEQSRVATEEVAILASEKNDLQRELQRNRRELDRLLNDPEYLELIARPRLNLKRLGEEIYRVKEKVQEP